MGDSPRCWERLLNGESGKKGLLGSNLQLREFRLGLLEDRNVGIGLVLEGEEILVGWNSAAASAPAGCSRSTHYTERMEFEWDPDKAIANLRKHKISFNEAATVFGDFFGATAADADHSGDEHRYVTGCRIVAGC